VVGMNLEEFYTVGFVFTVVNMKSTIFWYVTVGNLVEVC
jgi:hypothetical protein